MTFTAMAAVCAALATGAGQAAADGSLVTLIDNSHSDSVVEIDRTANLQTGSGSAGSDLADAAAGRTGTVLGLGRSALTDGSRSDTTEAVPTADATRSDVATADGRPEAPASTARRPTPAGLVDSLLGPPALPGHRSAAPVHGGSG
ncbi:hypothetical protein ACWGB8_21505 [Kitasatospora sp. NPDC054939]